MYLCVKGTEFASSYDFSMGLRNCSDSVALFVFLLDFGTVPRVWHYWFFYGTLELFQQCGFICFFLLDFGDVPTLWHYLFLYWILELFRQCGNVVFLLDFGTVPTLWHYLFLY